MSTKYQEKCESNYKTHLHSYKIFVIKQVKCHSIFGLTCSYSNDKKNYEQYERLLICYDKIKSMLICLPLKFHYMITITHVDTCRHNICSKF